MRLAYIEVSAGISGDMTLGALVDAGVPIDALRGALDRIPMQNWKIDAVPCSKSGISGTQVLVSAVHATPGNHHHNAHKGEADEHHHHHGRSCRELVDIIEASSLEERIIQKSTDILWDLATAEAAIHDSTPDQIHFHELGGLDTIIDIVGAVVGFNTLGVDEIVCSPLPVSHGFVDCAHGRLPVPAPATAELIKGADTFPIDIEGETVTPTGAAIATRLADRIDRFPAMTTDAIGYGCGTKDFPNFPNILRLFVGRKTGAMPGGDPHEAKSEQLITDRVALIETNIDDMNPELFADVAESAFEAGALDVWTAPIYMKKQRPATQLSALAPVGLIDDIAAQILRHSTSFGVRISQWQRRCIRREHVTVTTAYGDIRVKIGKMAAGPATVSPEYDDCLQAAREHDVPVKTVYAAALAAVPDA